jgi:hypothetical protein
MAKMLATHSLPNHEIEFQLSINNYFTCIMGHLADDSLQISIYDGLALLSGNKNGDMLSAPS